MVLGLDKNAGMLDAGEVSWAWRAEDDLASTGDDGCGLGGKGGTAVGFEGGIDALQSDSRLLPRPPFPLTPPLRCGSRAAYLRRYRKLTE